MRIFQVVNSLSPGDGVGNDIINKYYLYKEMGFETAIYSKWTHPDCAHLRHEMEELKISPNDIVLEHYAGRSHVSETVLASPGIKVMVYHNITPPSFFEPNTEEFKECTAGVKQLQKIYPKYDHFLGVSEFNLEGLKKYGVKGDMDVLPILINFDGIDAYSKKHPSIYKGEEKTFLFVGRVAPNKCHKNIIDIFNYYYENINAKSRLIFVGNYEGFTKYHNLLKEQIDSLACRSKVYFTGKVSDQELYAHYYNADMLICMSEHEGFCIPLLEAMYCNVPVMGFDACAVKSTMGGTGILVTEKNPEILAKACHCIFSNPKLMNEILEKQQKWVQSFSKDQIKRKVQLLINKWEYTKKFS